MTNIEVFLWRIRLSKNLFFSVYIRLSFESTSYLLQNIKNCPKKNQQKCLECRLIREIRKHGYKQAIKNTLAALKKVHSSYLL